MRTPKKIDPKSDDERTPKEAERERDAILKRMLQTKPKQQKDLVADRKGKLPRPR